jgi:hypothetical protein
MPVRLLAFVISLFLMQLFSRPVLSEIRPAGEVRIEEPRAVVLDSLGVCWIGSEDGLVLFDGQWVRRMGDWDGFEGGGIQALAVDQENRLWVAADSGLFRRDTRFFRVATNLQRPGSRIFQFAFGEGQLLRASSAGLFMGTGEGERALLTGVDVRCLWVSPQGEIFAGCAREGLYRFDARGNPTVMPREYREILPSISWISGDDTHLWLLGTDARGRETLLNMPLAGEGFRKVPLEALGTGEPGAGRRLARIGDEVLLLDQGFWRVLGEEGPGVVHPAGSTGLNWPIANPSAWLPGVFLQDLPGDFIKVSTDQGILAAGDERATLVWSAGRARPLQVLTRGNEGQRDRLLLLEQDGRRELYGSWGGGPFRRLALPTGSGPPQTLCWSPAALDGEVLVGFRDRLLRLSPEGDLRGTLAPGLGANWLQPIGQQQVLLAGENGLALLEGEETRPLAIREPVLRAAHDGHSELVALCARYLLQLDALNEIDTLALPEGFTPPVRQLLALPGGKVWLLDGEHLYHHSGQGRDWTRPLASRPGLESQLLSLARDGRGRLWLSSTEGTGYLHPDGLPPLIQLVQDPSRLEMSTDLLLDFLCSDPLRPGTEIRIRHRLNGGAWSAWSLERSLTVAADEPGLRKGANLLQVQARDEWGNLSAPPGAEPVPAGKCRQDPPGPQGRPAGGPGGPRAGLYPALARLRIPGDDPAAGFGRIRLDLLPHGGALPLDGAAPAAGDDPPVRQALPGARTRGNPGRGGPGHP